MKKLTVISKYWTQYTHVMISVWQHYYNSVEVIYQLQMRLTWYATNCPFYPFNLCVWFFPGMRIDWKQGREAWGEAAGSMQQILQEQPQLWSFCPLLFLCSSYIKCSVLTSLRGAFCSPILYAFSLRSKGQGSWVFPPLLFKKSLKERHYSHSGLSQLASTYNFWILKRWIKIYQNKYVTLSVSILGEVEKLRWFSKVLGVKSKEESWSISDCLLILWVSLVLQSILLLFSSMLCSLMPDGQRVESCFKVCSIFIAPKGEKNKNKP